MGLVLSRLCLFFCPSRILTDDKLLYKGNNSAIYQLPSPKIVCKVVYNYTMYLRERNFLLCMKEQEKYPSHIIHYVAFVPRWTFLIVETAEFDLLQWTQLSCKNKDYLPQLKIFLKQMALGYSFLLQHHIEHYDIKPDNLLLVNGVLKIADFGTCHFDQHRYALDTGTFGFIAPELVGHSNKDFYIPHSMDVYSICIMISYLWYAPIFKKFYNHSWTLEHYLALEKYMNDKYAHSFLKRGVIVDQRYRISIHELLQELRFE